MKAIKILGFLFFLFFTSILFSQETYLVPSEESTIQSAINVAENGDTIIVDEGEYYENIDFMGKEIYLSSTFIYTQNYVSISNTIINGSLPLDPDTASVVRIVSGEGPNAVLRGFTITGGNGTRTYNLEEDLYFRTGGGISCDQSSPTIIDNIIVDNHCEDSENVFAAGGGGLRVGFGQPYIARNTISQNSGGYAGGIMIAYCEGMLLENNIISYNHSDGDFGGGGGVYVDWENINIINNTIVFNSSDGTGGGLCLTGNQSIIKNCIIQENTASSASSESIRLRFGGNPVVDHSNIAGGWTGVDNIDEDSNFLDTTVFELSSSSPCVDSGDPAAAFYDIEDEMNPGMALTPAKGTVTNDMGAYGGQGYLIQTPTSISELITAWNLQATLDEIGLNLFLEENTNLQITVYGINGELLYFSPVLSYPPGKSIIPIDADGLLIIVVHETLGKAFCLKGLR